MLRPPVEQCGKVAEHMQDATGPNGCCVVAGRSTPKAAPVLGMQAGVRVRIASFFGMDPG